MKHATIFFTILAALLMPPASAAPTRDGDFFEANAPGVLVVRAPDGSVFRGVGTMAGCYAGVGACGPRAIIPAGHEVVGVWTIAFDPEFVPLNNLLKTYAGYRFVFKLAGASSSSGFADCTTHSAVLWTLTISADGARTISKTCAPVIVRA